MLPRSMARRASLPALLATACGLADVTLPRGVEQVVVQGVLNAQAAHQVLWIERTTPAGDPIEFGLNPLEQPPSRVEVSEAGGAVFTFLADTANPARFVATFTPVHGRRYELVVEAHSSVVRGSAVVPPPLTIVEPAADTVPHPRDSALYVRWASGTSRDVAVYLTSDTGDASRYIVPQWVRDDTVVVMGPYALSWTRAVWVVATDSVTARVFDFFRQRVGLGGERTFDGNLTGGVGVFGAVTSDRFIVRFQ